MKKSSVGKTFKMSFSGRELGLFIGGISLICLLFYLYGYSVGKNRIRESLKETASSQTSTTQEQVELQPQEKQGETPAQMSKVEGLPGEKGPQGGHGEVKVADLTFYRTLPDKGAEPVPRAADKPVASGAGAAGKEEALSATPGVTGAEKVKGEARDPSGPTYAVQVGSLRDWAMAMELKRWLIEKGYRAYVIQSGGDARWPWFKVRVGKFRDRNEAERVANELGPGAKFPSLAILVEDGGQR